MHRPRQNAPVGERSAPSKEFLLDGHELPMTAGGFVFVPRGTEHTVWNSGAVPVRGLIIISPGDAVHEFITVEAP